MGNALTQLRGWFSRRMDRHRIALVVQVAPAPAGAHVLGGADIATLVTRLAARIGAELAVPVPPPTGTPGLIAVMLTARSPAEAMALALRVQSVCLAGLDLPPQGRAVEVSAVLALARGGVSDDRLLAAGRSRLRKGGGTGQVEVISVGPAKAPADVARTGASAPHPVQMSQVTAWFQPQLCCHSGAVTGFELLARLNHPQGGVIPPHLFLPRLTPVQQRQLTRAMLAQGLAALHHWDGQGFSIGSVSLNVSAVDLAQPDFADRVLWELDRQDIAPARLVVEVMEDLSPLDIPGTVAGNLARLAEGGCRIDLDDFGTGYASFDALRWLRVNRVKIDRSFVAGCDSDPTQQRLILAILALAERLGIETLAEGVETRGEHAFVAQIGCSHVQGYAIARPMPLSHTGAFLSEQRDQAQQLPVLKRRA